MAFRGRGRGRGFQVRAPEERFVLFPDIEFPAKRDLDKEETLTRDSMMYLKKTKYYLEQPDGKNKNVEMSERSKIEAKREFNSFSQFLVPSMFPKELTRGSNVRQLSREKVQWDTVKKSDIDWDLFEKKEQSMDAKKNKEGENDEEEEEVDDEEEEEDDLSDDYDQGREFDDDEDDFNDKEVADDEDLL